MRLQQWFWKSLIQPLYCKGCSKKVAISLGLPMHLQLFFYFHPCRHPLSNSVEKSHWTWFFFLLNIYLAKDFYLRSTLVWKNQADFVLFHYSVIARSHRHPLVLKEQKHRAAISKLWSLCATYLTYYIRTVYSIFHSCICNSAQRSVRMYMHCDRVVQLANMATIAAIRLNECFYLLYSFVHSWTYDTRGSIEYKYYVHPL